MSENYVGVRGNINIGPRRQGDEEAKLMLTFWMDTYLNVFNNTINIWRPPQEVKQIYYSQNPRLIATLNVAQIVTIMLKR